MFIIIQLIENHEKFATSLSFRNSGLEKILFGRKVPKKNIQKTVNIFN